VTGLGTQGVVAVMVHQGREGRKGTELGGEVAAEVTRISAGNQETAEGVLDDETALGRQQCQEILVVGEDAVADRTDHLVAGGVLEESIDVGDSSREIKISCRSESSKY